MTAPTVSPPAEVSTGDHCVAAVTHATRVAAGRQSMRVPSEDPAAISLKGEARRLSPSVIRWLENRDIKRLDLFLPHPVRMARVLFDGRGRYWPSEMGRSALLIALIDGGRIADVVAWDPLTGDIATRFGEGACLGEGQIGVDGRGTTGLAMPVYRSPIGWLKAGRRGLVIVDPNLAAHRLAGLILEAEDEAHAAELSRILMVPPPTIVVSRNRRG